MATNFAEILSKRTDEIERPKPLPVGTYLAMVEGAPELREIGKKSTPAAEFKFRILSPGDDVDREALTAMGGIGEHRMRKPYFLTDESLYRLKEFLVDHLGIAENGRPIGQLLSEAPNQQVYVTVSHRPSEDGSQIYAEVKSTSKV